MFACFGFSSPRVVCSKSVIFISSILFAMLLLKYYSNIRYAICFSCVPVHIWMIFMKGRLWYIKTCIFCKLSNLVRIVWNRKYAFDIQLQIKCWQMLPSFFVFISSNVMRFQMYLEQILDNWAVLQPLNLTLKLPKTWTVFASKWWWWQFY